MEGSTSNNGRKKVRGAYYGGVIEKERAMLSAKWISHMQVAFDPFTGKSIGKYGKWFNNNMAHLLRQTVSPTNFYWPKVPKTEVKTIYERLSEKFLFPMDDDIINDAMDKNMQKYFSEWLCRMRKHWIENGGLTNNEAAKTNPFTNVCVSDWTLLCDHWATEHQKEMSQKNKANRAKMTMLGGHGSRSIVAHLHDNIDESGRLPSVIETFEQLYRKPKGWLSEAAEKAHQKMTQQRASQTMDDVSSDASRVDCDDAQLPQDLGIVTAVLGSRSRYKKGFGSMPRLKATGGKRARTSASASTTEDEERRKLKEIVIAQREYIDNMVGFLRQTIPGLTNLPPPPPVSFDHDATSQRSHSVHQEDINDVDSEGIENCDAI